MSDRLYYFLLIFALVLIALPPKWDPAVRIKEWQIRRWGGRW